MIRADENDWFPLHGWPAIKTRLFLTGGYVTGKHWLTSHYLKGCIAVSIGLWDRHLAFEKGSGASDSWEMTGVTDLCF